MKRKLKKRCVRRPRSAGEYSSLEARRMLAGNVNVFQADGALFIRGDNADNQIQVDVNSAGAVVVRGFEGTQINSGQEPFVYDTQDGTIPSLRANMGKGNDRMFVERVKVSGRVVAYGGPGDDSIGFFQSRVNGELLVQTFTGNDNVSIDNSTAAERLVIFTLDGDDTVGVDNSRVGDETLIVTGNGNDRLALKNSVHQKFVYVGTQSGDDFVGADNQTINDSISILTGVGADDVYVDNSNFNAGTFVNGGGNGDRLEIDGNTQFARTPTAKNFEGDDVAGGRLIASGTFNDLIGSGARLGTIAELASITPQLSSLLGAVQATGLTSALNGPGALTVFAPTNSAFAAVDSVVQSLSLEQLTDVLLFHVAEGVVFAGDLVQLESVDTLFGSSFSVDTSDGVVLNGNVTLAATDIRAKNGVVHVINQVLVPGAN